MLGCSESPSAFIDHPISRIQISQSMLPLSEDPIQMVTPPWLRKFNWVCNVIIYLCTVAIVVGDNQSTFAFTVFIFTTMAQAFVLLEYIRDQGPPRNGSSRLRHACSF